MQNWIKKYILLIIILLLALFLRTYQLSTNPPGFFCDEASTGYNAYTLIHTGKDENGISFPLFFRSFGDYKPPFMTYTTVPFVVFLGLNEISTRLPAVLYGMLTIIMIYFLGKELWSKKFGLLAAFIAATMPWLIHYNRIGFELNSYCAFFVMTVYFFLKAAKHKSFIIPAFLTASLTLYTYTPARLLVLLLLAGVMTIYWKKLLTYKKQTATGFLIFLIFCIPFALNFINGTAAARFNMVSVFSANLSLTVMAEKIIFNYFYQLSPSFFFRGEPTPIFRHFTNGLLPVLKITIPFVFLGIIYLFKTVKKKSSQLFLYWLFIYPIAGAVVAEPPYTSRAIIGAPLFVILISFGIYWFVKLFKNRALKKTVIFCLGLVILINTFSFANFYFNKYPLYSAGFWGWQYGTKDIVTFFAEKQKEYDDLVISNDFNAPYIFFRFYAPTDCQKCKVGYPTDLYNPTRKQLFAVTPDYMRNFKLYHWKIIKTIYYPDKTPAFVLTEIIKQNK